MASTNSWTLELESKVSAPRKFRACVMDWHTLAPKLAPHVIDNAHHVEGDGGIGTVGHYNCGSAVPFNAMKKKVEFLDVDKCECKYTIECDGVETSTWNIKMKPTANGGSVAMVECTSKGAHANDMMLKAKESAAEMFKSVEAYLIANPNAYN
ncbi:pathogenesis-related protein 1-like [Lolium rigidum]|uniref:pathogenesis-related protein 1-like n=1 Tax=Lolium rigidum TaxID=89674 RepID=UPI001F5DD5C7|nr:pathogenesis-related protein 1-like [Lolium rigidum]